MNNHETDTYEEAVQFLVAQGMTRQAAIAEVDEEIRQSIIKGGMPDTSAQHAAHVAREIGGAL